MDLLIKNIKIVSPGSSYHQKQLDILIKDGKIEAIDSTINSEFPMYDGTGKSVSLGWFDMRSFIADPGLEHREDLQSGLNTAAKGGFTEIACLPNTKPVIDGKDVYTYVKAKTASHIVNVYPIGAVTQKCEGKALSEMMDLNREGAVAFSDGEEPIWHTGILMKSLQYVSSFNGLIMNQAIDKYLMSDGLVHEGINSTISGMAGIPTIAETIAIQRDLDILRYAEGRLHFSKISSKKSVELIKAAKEEGLQVTCDVTAHQLLFNDETIKEFDSNNKVNPPYRTEEDRLALIEAVKTGVIDVVVSDHTPHDEESKKLEYDYASFGITAFETVYPMLSSVLDDDELIIEKISLAPRNILGYSTNGLNVGDEANLTIFDSNKEWEYLKTSSKSKNSPWLGKSIKGFVHAVINNNQIQEF